MEPEGSLPHSQASATRPYPGLAQSSPHTHNPLIKIYYISKPHADSTFCMLMISYLIPEQ